MKAAIISLAEVHSRAQKDVLSGQLDRARALLYSTLRVCPQDIPTKVLLAQIELAVGRAESCLKLLESFPVKKSPQAGLHALYGEALLHRNRMSEAFVSFRRALCLAPSRQATWQTMMRDLEPLVPHAARRQMGRSAAYVIPFSALAMARRSGFALSVHDLEMAQRLSRMACVAGPSEVAAARAFVATEHAIEFPSGTAKWGLRSRILVPDGFYLSYEIAQRLMTDGRSADARALLCRSRLATLPIAAARFAAESRVRRSGRELGNATRAGRRGSIVDPSDPISLIELSEAHVVADEYRSALRTTRWIECFGGDSSYPYVRRWARDRRSQNFGAILYYRRVVKSLSLDRPRDRLIAAGLLCDGVGYRHRLTVTPEVSTFDLAPPLVNSPVGHPRFNDRLGDLIFERLGPLAGEQVADIGGADGYFAFRAAENGARSVILDPSPLFLERARLFRTLLNLEDRVRIVPGVLDGAHADVVEPCSIWLMLGLIYHLGNVIEGLRLATARPRILVIEYAGTDDNWSDDDARLHKDNQPVSRPWLAGFLDRAGYTIEQVPEWAEFVADQPRAANRRLLIARPS